MKNRKPFKPFNRVEAFRQGISTWLLVTRAVYRKSSNRVEAILQWIPTWLFVAVAVVGLSRIALWVEDGVDYKSLRSIMKTLFQNAESIAIAAAVILYFKEAPDRKAQKHHEAWQVIDSAAAAKVPTSYARFRALEDLNQDGVSLRGVDLPSADLQGINLSFADLRGANLKRADLRGANLTGANLADADLTEATLLQADFTNATINSAGLAKAYLVEANLERADCNFAQLEDANLRRAAFFSAYLAGTDLYEADLEGACFLCAILVEASFSKANLTGADFTQADLREVRSLESMQVKSTNNWETYVYDLEFRAQLGLPLASPYITFSKNGGLIFHSQLPDDEDSLAENDFALWLIEQPTAKDHEKGEEVTIPQHYRKAEKRLKRLQRKLSKKKKGSKRRAKAVKRVAKAHLKVANQRQDFHHKTVNRLLSKAKFIAYEDLNIKGLARTRLAKSISDAGWGQFLTIAAYKAARAGGGTLPRNPARSSIDCSDCGAAVPKTLADRWHICACGAVYDRDHNAARNIKQRAVGHPVQAPRGDRDTEPVKGEAHAVA
jgi:IS605 OrfB family transposase